MCEHLRVSSDTAGVAPNLIRTARAGAGLSQAALGDALDVRQQTVAKWETGENRPTLDNLVRLQEVIPDFDLYGAVVALWPAVGRSDRLGRLREVLTGATASEIDALVEVAQQMLAARGDDRPKRRGKR